MLVTKKRASIFIAIVVVAVCIFNGLTNPKKVITKDLLTSKGYNCSTTSNVNPELVDMYLNSNSKPYYKMEVWTSKHYDNIYIVLYHNRNDRTDYDVFLYKRY